MKPYYERAGIVLYHGDCREILPTLTEGTIDVVLTDPPYNVSHRSGREGTTVGRIKRKHTVTGARPDGSDSYREIVRDFGEWDHEWDPAPFLEEAARLLRPGGSLVAFTSEFLIADYLASDLNHRSLIYWHKANPAPNFRGHYQRAVEMAVWQTKGGRWTFNAGGATQNVLDAPIVSGWRCENTNEKREHPTQKPEAIMLRLVEVHSSVGETILDPFAGSGTTGVAAFQLHRKAILIEREEKWAEVTAKRLAAQTDPLPLYVPESTEQAVLL